MKIGILTFHSVANYGAFFQAYALQKKMQDLGYDVEIIDYHSNYLEKYYIIKPFIERHSIKDIAKYFFYDRDRILKNRKFNQMLDQKCKLSRSYDEASIFDAEQLYDYFIVGSDQVWNYKHTNFDTTYFLDFVKDSKRKYSYAASFGMSLIPEEFESKYYDLLGKFQICSVRESDAIEILHMLQIQKARQDIDPTLLLSKNEWEKDFGIETVSEPYIFVYYMELTTEIIQFADNLSIKTGLPIKYVGSSFGKPFKKKSFFIKAAGPFEFLYYLSHAKFVVTNSFHGCALSIALNKDFYVGLLKKGAQANNRILNLIKLVNLESRLMEKYKDDSILLSPIDYSEVNTIIEKEKTKSIEYLLSIKTIDRKD